MYAPHALLSQISASVVTVLNQIDLNGVCDYEMLGEVASLAME